jgi:hypothetical protein
MAELRPKGPVTKPLVGKRHTFAVQCECLWELNIPSPTPIEMATVELVLQGHDCEG